MVGVPGRSKACNTCKQRKIACTLERPQCAQCIKSNRMCSGYQRERIFITKQSRFEETLLHTSSQKPLRSADARPSFASRKKNDPFPLTLNEQVTRISPTRYTELLLSPTQHVSVRHAFRQQLLSEFIYSYMPDSTIVPLQPTRKDKVSWLVLVAELPELTRALETAVLAMSTAKIGRMNDDPVLVKASLKSYVQGLWELQKALWDPNLMYRDETLAACMALWMYEVMECPAGSVSGWISHFDGCQRLVQLRGAKAHSSMLGHQVFLAFRTTAIYQVIKSHRATYLAGSDWTELPWQDSHKTPFDCLLDKTAALANLFVQGLEILELKTTNLLPAGLEIVDRCWKMEAELRKLYEDFESSNLGPLYWPQLSTEENPADDAKLGKVFPVAFYFPNLTIAFTCMIYWASIILLWAVLSQLYQVLATINVHDGALGSSSGGSCPTCSDADISHDTCHCAERLTAAQIAQFDMSELPPIEPRIDVLAATRNICQSLEYCMRQEMRCSGATVTVIPLMAVIDVLRNIPQCRRELAWAQAAFEKVNARGFRLMKFLDTEDIRQCST